MPSEKQYQERRENIISILQYIRTHGPASRRQISANLSLSWGCVSELVSILLLQKILLEDEGQSTGVKGRTPTLLRLNEDVHFLGVDINRNGLNACVCDLSGEKVAAYSDTLRCGSKEELLHSVCSFVERIADQSIAGICFAMQGIPDEGKQVWAFPAEPPIPIDFSKELQNRLDIPFTVEHDPNCILYGCLDATKKNIMIVRLDRGIGAAIYTQNGFLENDLLELGHLVVTEDGQRLQELVSLNALEQAEDRDAYFAAAGKHLGVTLGNLCNLICLDKIYLCGDLTRYYPRFRDTMEQHYGKTVLPGHSAKLSVVDVTDAGYGAAKMAMDKFQY